MNEEKFDKFINKIEPYMILVIIASFVGVLGGILGTLFLDTIDIFVWVRKTFKYVILLMPLVGVFTIYLDKVFKIDKKDTKFRNSVKNGKDIPDYVIPTLYAETALAHFTGASVGRMEDSVEMGGALGSLVAKFFNLVKKDKHTIIASGVAALFSSIFGIPFTGTIFAYELCYTKKDKKPIYFMPLLLAAAFSRFVGFAFGSSAFIDRIVFIHHPDFELKQVLFIILLIVICLLFAIFFNKLLSITKQLFSEIKNEYVRIIIGSVIMIGVFWLFNDNLFLGNEPLLMKKTLLNNQMWYIFIVKAILTAICLGVGFKGGKVGPAFISGAAFGAVVASLFGLDPLIGVAIGVVCLFGGVTGTVFSSVALGVEIFGFKSIAFFIIIALVLNYFIKKNYIVKEI